MGLYSLVSLLFRLVDLYQLLIVIWCVMSWIPRGNETVERIRYVIGPLVEPYLGIFRRLIPSVGGIDFSPILAIVVLNLAMRLVAGILI